MTIPSSSLNNNTNNTNTNTKGTTSISSITKDPYTVLGLSHDATQKQIKDAYRKLALRLHPDRLTRQGNANEIEMNDATTKFADVTSAYAILSDLSRKQQFDHIYKYGGFDHLKEDHHQQEESKCNNINGSNKRRQAQQGQRTRSTSGPSQSSSSQKGIGYACTDHLAFLLSQGKQKSTTIAGIQIPSRLHVARPHVNNGGGGFRLSFSSGQVQQSPCGSKRYISKTTQFVAGKKFTKVETTVVHPDGRKEIVIEGDDYVERKFVNAPPSRQSSNNNNTTSNSNGSNGSENVASQHCIGSNNHGDVPWYMEAWQGIRNKLTACYNPCVPVHVQ